MKIKNTHLKKTIAILAMLFTTLWQSLPQTTYAWDDDSDSPFSETTIVRFGLIDKETGEIVQSQPDYFFDHFKYGIAHSIYNSIYYVWHDNADMAQDVGLFWDELSELLGTEFFSVLSSQRYLMNIMCSPSTGYVFVCLNRTPGRSDYPFYNFEQTESSNLLFEIGPSGYKSGAWVYTISAPSSGAKGISNFSPYYTRTFSSIGDVDNPTTVATSYNSVTTFSELVTRLSQPNTRSVLFKFQVHIPDCHIVENSLTDFIYTSYVNSYSPQGFSYSFQNNTYSDLNVVMSDFPFYENYEENFWKPNIYPSGSSYGKSNTIFNISRIYERFLRDVPPFKISSQTPILITGYDEIPSITPTPTPIATATPTPTPTAIPTITLMPSPTPSGVSPIEGVETMFSLFTRKYNITVMGVTVGIRPFFIFIGCFIVGSVITMIQGGNKS